MLTDCHVHVFGEVKDFPLDPNRVYTPSISTVEHLLEIQHICGLSRAVLVQPSPYGTDNSCMIDALNRLQGRTKGIAVINNTSDLTHLNHNNVVGVRVNVATGSGKSIEEILKQIQETQEQIHPFNWHLQLFTKNLALLEPHLKAPLVIDHMAWISPEKGLQQPNFQALLRLINKDGNFAKLSAFKRLAKDDLNQLTPFIKTLVKTNSNALLWGSDFPHTGGGRGNRAFDEIEPFAKIDDKAVLNYLQKTLGDKLFEQVMAKNPQNLYGF